MMSLNQYLRPEEGIGSPRSRRSTSPLYESHRSAIGIGTENVISRIACLFRNCFIDNERPLQEGLRQSRLRPFQNLHLSFSASLSREVWLERSSPTYRHLSECLIGLSKILLTLIRCGIGECVLLHFFGMFQSEFG